MLLTCISNHNSDANLILTCDNQILLFCIQIVTCFVFILGIFLLAFILVCFFVCLLCYVCFKCLVIQRTIKDHLIIFISKKANIYMYMYVGATCGWSGLFCLTSSQPLGVVLWGCWHCYSHTYKDNLSLWVRRRGMEVDFLMLV